MGAAVAVELSPTDASSPYVAALLETCTIGMHSTARCVLGQDSTASDNTVVVVVTWAGSQRDGARIDVGSNARGRSRWQTREISFAPSDPEIERWRTAGFAIATLVGEVVARDESESKQEVVATKRVPSSRNVEVDDHETPARSWLDGRFVIATGAQGFSPAQGAELRFSRMLDAARWFLTGAVQFTLQRVDPYSISVVLPGASIQAGIVAVRLGARVRLELRVGAMAQAIEVSGRDLTTGATDSGGGFRAGLTQGIDISWLWSERFGVVAGFDAAEATASTEIRAREQIVAHIPALSLAAGAGLRLTLP